ncbi:zinc-binding dehydrogenase [Komagataeibacter europaeus]|uniref:zinc-binding dehydrogenase n=1 Tax=Komagataeibacter europaeus TaxID=33995 RepID=UPI000B3E7823
MIEWYHGHSTQLFNWIIGGKLQVHIEGTYPLADAARAPTDMESRKTADKLLEILTFIAEWKLSWSEAHDSVSQLVAD